MSSTQKGYGERISYTNISQGNPGRHPPAYYLLEAAIQVMHIPVYFESFDEWKSREMGGVESRFEQYAQGYEIDIDEARGSQAYQAALGRFDPYAWDYNQVVGWLRLWAGSIIWAECWWPPVKAIRRQSKSRFIVPYGVVFQCDTEGLDSDRQRFDLAREALEGLATVRPFKPRYIDLVQFLDLGPSLAWTNLEIQALVRSLPDPR